VGPNGAGKSTVFRLIMGEESADEGQIAIDRNVTIGHFSQDVGEMQGTSALAATMDGAGPVSALGKELRVLELLPEGINRYSGGYLEYVARSGHEAPGLRA
jgi:ATPase subunit of ABC transporter with duplicated ATPase domains